MAEAPQGEPPRAAPAVPLAPPAASFERGELIALLARPDRALQQILAEPARLAKTVGRSPALLVALLLLVSVLFALPYGAVLDAGRVWRIALLFVGTLGICLPSLQVFSAYIGYRVDPAQSVALGLVMTAVAALFTFGFFPILWFLRATMAEDSTITPQHLSVLLIVFSLAAGVVHLVRCLVALDGARPGYPLLLAFWQLLYAFIAYRMALLLDLA